MSSNLLTTIDLSRDEDVRVRCDEASRFNQMWLRKLDIDLSSHVCLTFSHPGLRLLHPMHLAHLQSALFRQYGLSAFDIARVVRFYPGAFHRHLHTSIIINSANQTCSFYES